MTVYIMGHGEFSGPPTFLPAGRTIGIYATEGTPLSIAVGMQVVAEPGGCTPRKVFGTERDRTVPNYRVGPLTHLELKRMLTVASPANEVLYLGHTPGLPDETRLCTRPESCRLPAHAPDCEGLLAILAAADLRLVFCLADAKRAGLTEMTLDLPAGTEVNERANRALRRHRERALVWNDRLAPETAAAESAHREFLALAERDEAGAREAAFLIASSNLLERNVIRHDLTALRRTAGHWAVLDLLASYPAKTRALAHEALRDTGRTVVIMPDAVELFAAEFPRATTAERYEAWRALTPAERERLTVRSELLRDWAREVVPAVERIRALLRETTDPVATWFRMPALTAAENEYLAAEIEQDDAFRTCVAGVLAFAKQAPPAAKLALWERLSDAPAARQWLESTAKGDPASWRAAHLESRVTAGPDPVGDWLADHLRPTGTEDPAPEDAEEPAAPEPEPTPTADEYADFWDGAAYDNLRATGAWNVGTPVLVVRSGTRFRFTDAATWTELSHALPQTPWGAYQVSAVTLHDIELEYIDGPVDRAALTPHLPGLLAGSGRVVITLK
ncbi:putative adhesin [Kitasatospora sp. NPDC088391]|uniref:putative adhesin n=1 Tax=Kitasatospora sp. NPDC088391 TaxID=3364074 RepID=UPI0037F5B03E